MHHLRMKEQGIQLAIRIDHRSHRRIGARRGNCEPCGGGRHEISMARPDPDLVRDTGKQG